MTCHAFGSFRFDGVHFSDLCVPHHKTKKSAGHSALDFSEETRTSRSHRRGCTKNEGRMTTIFDGYDEEYRALASDISKKLSEVASYEDEKGACLRGAFD
jgi:hypothetical protein